MHKRLPKYVEVPVRDIDIDPNFVTDPRIVQTYADLHAGKVKVALTRLPSQLIQSGFYTRKADGSTEHVSNLDERVVPHLTAAIRAGVRPELDVQWNPHVPGGGGYVCADDEPVLAAYRALGIAMVPCRVLRPIAKPGPEAAIWLANKGKNVSHTKSIAPLVNSYSSYLGEKQIALTEALESLIEISNATALAVREFHKDGGYDVHYHEMLHALMRRHVRVLESMLALVQLGRREHAMALCRMAYEAFLNFYLDWLAPQFFGPRLQLLSALRHSEEHGSSEKPAAWQALGNFPGLFENASEKARLSPLGTRFHSLMYPSLSLIAHQSYQHLELEASAFDSEEPAEKSLSDAQLTRCLDLLTTALLIRVRNDVGLQ